MKRLKGAIYWAGLFVLTSVCACSHKYYITKSQPQLYPIGPASPVDSSVLAFYKPYKQNIDSAMNSVIGIAAVDIVRLRPEGLLNNLFADAMASAAFRSHITFDFVHSNFKSLRISIPKGEIRTSKIYEVMPFENLMVTVQMRGDQVQELFDYMAREGGDPIAHASYRIVNGKARDILINDKPLQVSGVYTVLTSDYVANGGDGAAVYLKATGRREYPVKVRDALLDYIKLETKAGRRIDPKIEGRVKSDKQASDE